MSGEAHVPRIDIAADLNFESDECGVVLARVPAAGAPAIGTVVVAGTPAAWSRARVEAVEEGWVHLRLLTGREVG